MCAESPDIFCSECWHRKNKSDSNQITHCAFATIKAKNKEAWFLDSCASAHMTGINEILLDTERYEQTIITACNAKLQTRQKNTVKLPNYLSHNNTTIDVQGVIYVCQN